MKHPPKQHRSVRPRPKVSDPSDRPEVTTIADILEHRPLMFWGGVWATVVLVALVALSGLLNPSASTGQRASGAAVGTSTVAVQSEHKSRIPLWLFGAIALSCTAGSIFVSKHLTQADPLHPTPRPRTRPPRAVKPVAVKASLPAVGKAKQKKLRPVKPQTRSAALRPTTSAMPPRVRQPYPVPGYPLPPKPAIVPTRTSAGLPTQAYPVPRPAPPVTQPAVSIVPSEENHPLDWGEASLADMLDLRKQRSLYFD